MTRRSLLPILLACLTLVPEMVSAQAAFQVIYRTAGLVASAGPTGLGTAIHCTNPTNARANVRVLVYRHDATLVGHGTVAIAPKRTRTIATGPTALFPSATDLNTGSVFQGQAVIKSDTSRVFCSVVVLDRGSAVPKFMTRLHMVKYPRGDGGED